MYANVGGVRTGHPCLCLPLPPDHNTGRPGPAGLHLSTKWINNYPHSQSGAAAPRNTRAVTAQLQSTLKHRPSEKLEN